MKRLIYKKVTYQRKSLSGEENELWIGSYGDGLIHVSRRQIVREYKTNNLSRDIIRSIAHINKKDTLWLGTFGGLGLFRPSTNSTTWFTRTNGLSSDSINVLAFDKDSKLWIGTHNGGLLKLKSSSLNRYEMAEYGDWVHAQIRFLFPGIPCYKKKQKITSQIEWLKPAVTESRSHELTLA